MIYFFILILFIMIIVNIQLTKDILHPIILFKGVWLISLIVYVAYKNVWGFVISDKTLGVFFMGFLFFDLGFLFFKILKLNFHKKNKQHVKNNFIKKNRILALLFVSIITSILLFFSIINTVGMSSVFSKDFFILFRDMQYDGSGSANKERLLFKFVQLIGISAFIFLLRERNGSRNRKMTYILIMLFSFGIMIFSTGRMWLLSIIIQMVVISIVYNKDKGTYFTLNSQFKYLKRAFVLGVSFLIFFYAYGKITADKIDATNVFNKIAVYTSSPLIAFDQTWEYREKTSNYFGEYLFSPIYNIIDKLFLTNIIQDKDRLPYIFGDNGFATNVYTFYDTQIRDFGVFAIPVVMFFLGVFIAILKYKSESELQIGFWTALYASFMYSLLLSFFNDKFFGYSTATYLTIIVYFIIFKTKFINSKYNHSTSG